MLTLLLILASTALLSCLLTPLVGAAAVRLNLVDRPDARRKLHGRAIPLAGGIAILASATLVLVCTYLLPNPLRAPLQTQSDPLLGLLLAAAFICALGVVDDFGCLRGKHKLLGQVAAAALVVAFGVRVERVEVFGQELELGLLAVPFTVFWLLGTINSLNLLDGMDGHLGCIGTVLALALAGMAVLQGNWVMACVAATLAGGLLGFLRWNLPPASVFLGDAGSMLTGLVIGVVAIQSSLKGPATALLVAPIAVLTVPFLDTFAALIRRKLTGRSIYSTDRGHLHHCMLRRGLSVPAVLAVVSLLSALSVAGALASLALKNELIAVASTLTVACVLLVTRLFGHAEFVLVRQRLARLAASLMRLPGGRPPLDLDVHLQGTGNWKALMDAVTGEAEALNLCTVSLDVSAPALHEQYHARWKRSEAKVDEVLWRAEVPLMIADRVVGSLLVSGPPDEQSVGAKVAELCRLIEEYQREGYCTESLRRWRKDNASWTATGSLQSIPRQTSSTGQLACLTSAGQEGSL